MVGPKDTLLLDVDHTPLQVLDWQRAVWLVLTARVRPVETYDHLVVRSSSVSLAWPAVVALARKSPTDPASVPLSRAAVFARDRFTCQYCGLACAPRADRPPTDTLTVDHVVPRARGRAGRVVLADGRVVATTSWENLVTACRACNHRKADRTPEQAGMPLRVVPRRPTRHDVVRIVFARVEIEEAWAPYLPEGTGLRRAA